MLFRHDSNATPVIASQWSCISDREPATSFTSVRAGPLLTNEFQSSACWKFRVRASSYLPGSKIFNKLLSMKIENYGVLIN